MVVTNNVEIYPLVAPLENTFPNVPNGFAIDVKKYEMSFANEIIEQFMLTANEVVAQHFYWLEAPFIYRVHEEPDEEKVEELNKFLYN